jgi:amino acid permease
MDFDTAGESPIRSPGAPDSQSLPQVQAGATLTPKHDKQFASRLHRGLSARQVQMIAIAGTIGTGLFLGTGRSLAQGGPASVLVCYAIIGFIVYITLLLLGEMATQYPVAGKHSFSSKCCAICMRIISLKPFLCDGRCHNLLVLSILSACRRGLLECSSQS